MPTPHAHGWCQIFDSITIPSHPHGCPNPPVARITHHHGGTTMLCQEDLDSWLDNADNDPGMEPAGLRLLAVQTSV